MRLSGSVLDADFHSVRPRLFGIACRVLGSASDADDVVQEVWIRWQGTDRARVRDRTGFLVTTTSHVALNVALSARARREIPVGDRMPEPGRAADDPSTGAERAESLELAVLVLLERLWPAEREPNARQLGRRARIRLAGPPRASVDSLDHADLLAAILDAAQRGPVARLEQVLTGPVRSPSAPPGGGIGRLNRKAGPWRTCRSG
ncbi:MAG TPA: sigma factor [Pseudonocardia sp.]